MTLTLKSGMGILGLAAVALWLSTATAGVPAKQQLQLPAGDLKWEQPFGPSGPKLAFVSGDMKKGPCSFFFKFPAGFDSGWHTHDADYTAVVLAGTMQNVEQGAEAASHPLGVGSAW